MTSLCSLCQRILESKSLQTLVSARAKGHLSASCPVPCRFLHSKESPILRLSPSRKITVSPLFECAVAPLSSYLLPVCPPPCTLCAGDRGQGTVVFCSVIDHSLPCSFETGSHWAMPSGSDPCPLTALGSQAHLWPHPASYINSGIQVPILD